MFKQYHAIKSEYADSILLFRMGDFYETFYEDAKIASEVLGIALTARNKGPDAVPLAGIPYHSLEGYLAKLLRAGYRVAICEQVEDPKLAKGLVRREVVRIVTPGTLTADGLLEEKENNFLAGINPGQKGWAGLAWVDLSTGTFLVRDVPHGRVIDELTRLKPAEILLPETYYRENEMRVSEFQTALGGASITPRPDWRFDRETAYRDIVSHFRIHNLEGFGIEEHGPSIGAAGAALDYLRETQKSGLEHIRLISPDARTGRMHLDRSTQKSLELTETLREGERQGTLLYVLDRTRTPMGARLLRSWLLAPLVNVEEIERRLNAVSELFENAGARDELAPSLKRISDLERLTTKMVSGSANGRDLLALGRSLGELPGLKKLLSGRRAELLWRGAERIDTLKPLADEIERAIVGDPPFSIREGGIIKQGYSEELDGIRVVRTDGKSWIASYQQRMLKETGIPTLKVGFNRVFGYYIEVTKMHEAKVPETFIRKQTLKNAERYITPELKEYEDKVLHAEERANELEYRLFVKLRDRAAAATAALQENAAVVSEVDVIASFVDIAVERGYARPEVNEGELITIRDGRHPVLDASPMGEPFIPNDALLDRGENRIIIITGPNMAGKSTYIRQVALLVLMAQTGSFIPAGEATIGVVDAIFTRVGAADELHRGRSTFMVEMTETANILNNATERSLIVLDEVGRGTSTFDGVSLAWAITEYISRKSGARTLFATHYHELTELAETEPGVKNANIAVKEWGDEIIFLRKILPGGTDKSYGLHVARLAGIPQEVVKRAAAVLANLEALNIDGEGKPSFAPPLEQEEKRELQLSLFKSSAEKVIEILQKLEIGNLTPLEALTKLAELQDLLRPE
ncbi:MAG: DNA mismatch repair protein MutS [Planctomycetota bacterium]|nr:MAG: DNA mismatch repair protein MutS [Planctomycetota bacterium]